MRPAVRRVVLGELTPDQLAGVAAGASELLCLTAGCTLRACAGELPTVRDCVYGPPRTQLCE